MKFTCQKIDLQNLLHDAWAVAHKAKSYNNWFLIESDQGSHGVRIKASNHFAYYCKTLVENVQQVNNGQLKLYAPSFKAIIDSLSVSDCDTVTIFKDDVGAVQIISGSAKFEVGCADTSSFPLIKGAEPFHEIFVPSEGLRSVVRRVAYIQNNQIPAIEVMMKNNKLRICATDGFRLAYDCVGIDSDIDDTIYLSHEAVSTLADLANSKDGTIRLGWNNEDVTMRYENTLVEVRRHSISFPPVDHLMGVLSKNPLEVKISTSQLSSVLKALSVFHDERNICPLHLTFSDDKVNISLKNKGAGMGSGEWEIPCEFNSKDPFKISFNPRFMMEFTQGILGSEMTIRMKDPKTPVVMELKEADYYKRETCENMKMMMSPMMP
jgi:DNA polymerase III sliding clamp (beta) subunit (PCNA family)